VEERGIVPTSRRRRPVSSADRRQDILGAALDVFASEGFSAARLDDVAVKAGIAKGTIYLHFRDKQDLFEQLVMGVAEPLLARMREIAAHGELPMDRLLATLFDMFQREILATRRKEVLRLVIAEGPRFPAIAAFYHREVLSKALAIVRAIAERAAARGEIASATFARYPQLIFAPLLMAVVWDGLFAAIDPLDVEGLLAAHRQIVAGRQPECPS
jgi:AcrR family transcriptional regulator